MTIARPHLAATRRRFLRSAGATAASGVGVLAAACGQPTATPAGDGSAAKRGGPPAQINFNTWYEVVTQPLVPLIEEWGKENDVEVTLDVSSSNRDMAKYTAWYV